MKLFKKALVASAIIGSFAAQAVTIAPSTKIELSAEGVQYGVAPVAADVEFDIVVEANHPATTEITLTFDGKVDLNGLLGGSCVALPPVGSETSDQCGDVVFSYGNGNFTFDNVVVTEAAAAGQVDKITFEVSTGNAITAFSSFGVLLGGTKVMISGATAITYDSYYNANLVEHGVFDLATEKSQFTFALTQELDGVIQREDQNYFISGTATASKDELKYTLTNDESLTLALTDADIDVVVSANFEDVDQFTTTSGAISTPVASMSTGAVEFDTLTGNYAYTTPTPGVLVEHKETWGFETPMLSGVIPVTGNAVLMATVTTVANGTTFPTTGHSIVSGVDAGEWALDATIINVPYFPVNYADTSSSVHIANEASKDADVIVTAIDNNGVEYGPLNLGFAANGNTVTKVSQGAIAKLFNITAATKLSVTFNLDADKENVSAYAVTQNTKGRSEVSNSQLKGK